MKKTSILAIPAAAISIVAQAQIDYSNPVVDVAVSESEITANTAGTASVVQALAVDDGTLVFFNRGAADGEASLNQVDLSGVSPAFTEIASQTELEAGTVDNSYPDVNGLVVIEGATPTYLLSQFNGSADDVFSVVPGPTPTVTNLTEFDGIFGIRTDGTNVFIMTENFFGAPEDAIYSIPVSGGTPSIAVSNAQLAPPGASEVGATAFALDTSATPAIAYVFSEFAFQGASQVGDIIMSANTATASSGIFLEYSSAPFGSVSDLVTDSNGTLYVWNDAVPQLDVFDSAGILLGSVGEGTILTALGSVDTADFNLDSNHLAANVVDADTVELFIANSGQNNIVRLTFSSTAGVSDWDAYQ